MPPPPTMQSSMIVGISHEGREGEHMRLVSSAIKAAKNYVEGHVKDKEAEGGYTGEGPGAASHRGKGTAAAKDANVEDGSREGKWEEKTGLLVRSEGENKEA